MNNETWVKNPTFKLKILKETEMEFNLFKINSSDKKSIAISIHLFKGDKKTLLTPKNTMIKHTNNSS